MLKQWQQATFNNNIIECLRYWEVLLVIWTEALLRLCLHIAGFYLALKWNMWKKNARTKTYLHTKTGHQNLFLVWHSQIYLLTKTTSLERPHFGCIKSGSCLRVLLSVECSILCEMKPPRSSRSQGRHVVWNVDSLLLLLKSARFFLILGPMKFS